MKTPNLAGAVGSGTLLGWTGFLLLIIAADGRTQTPTADWDTDVPPGLEVVRSRSGHLLVEPHVHGVSIGKWILDTGASGIIVDKKASSKLLIPVLGRGVTEGISGRKLYGDVVQLERLALGPMTLNEVECIRLDLGDISKQMHRPIAGILGYEVFAHSVVVLEMQTPAVSLFDPDVFVMNPDLPWRGLIVYERVPCVWGRYEDEVGVFRLDIGAPLDTVTFHGPEGRRLAGNWKTHSGTVTVRGAAGSLTLKKMTLDWFQLFDHQFNELKVNVSDSTRGAFADPYLAGNIGGVMLRPFRVYLHMPRRKIACLPFDEGALKKLVR